MNRKNIFFLVLGIIVSSIPAYYAAEILFADDELNYNNNSSKLNSTNVQDALVELYNLANTEYNPIPNTGFKLGDYFTMVLFKLKRKLKNITNCCTSKPIKTLVIITDYANIVVFLSE